jgi:hypothetical protein
VLHLHVLLLFLQASSVLCLMLVSGLLAASVSAQTIKNECCSTFQPRVNTM